MRSNPNGTGDVQKVYRIQPGRDFIEDSCMNGEFIESTVPGSPCLGSRKISF